MTPVIVESPFKGDEWQDLARNQVYLELCLRDCIDRGETPYASHKMLTKCLNDRDAAERRVGIDAGLVWRRLAELRVFYVDYGWSSGMLKARALYDAEGLKYEVRTLGAERMRVLGEAMGMPANTEHGATAETLRPPRAEQPTLDEEPREPANSCPSCGEPLAPGAPKSDCPFCFYPREPAGTLPEVPNG